MKFISDPNFSHSLFKDVVRIDYQSDMPPYLINDYGYTYLMFCYGDFEAVDHKGNLVPVPQKLVKGTGDYFSITAHKDNIWITLEMPNHVLYNITGIPSNRSRNVLYDLESYVDPTVLDSLYDALRNKESISGIIETVDEHLSHYYSKWGRPLKSTPIVEYIYQEKGLITLADLQVQFPYSERTLERMFNKEVGCSPYRFICLVRFNYVIREIENNPEVLISDLTAQYNYYDHSHFEKDFQKFLGQSVSNYKNEFNPLLTQALARKFVKADDA
ncbi:helix-turn-helix domain-containing protein [Nonlabens marinus]|uniref:Transcriptional regulator, AraC family n=1 Tax=Nonlabens marinus S1-08 TaxID=1454201 RepID=W8VVC9_9FLAO|nr:helix-turn-helix domain-containing protein [Nonlabens marinus]BAO55333.1 transcriptional regulator, AraC family [Nonlabens marinus S1-08]